MQTVAADPRPVSHPPYKALLRSVYEVSFLLAIGLTVVSVAGGFAWSWRAHRSLPPLSRDALLQARQLEAAGDLPRALEQYRRAVALAPANPDFRNELGVIYAMLRRFPEAIAEFEQAVRLGGGALVRANLERARQDRAKAESRR